MQEIYALARESFFGGQKAFQLQAFPFRMTALNMAKHRNNQSFAFWKMLKEGYDHFEATHQEPKVAVCEKRYVFDAAAPNGSTRPLSFNPTGACPVYQLDKTVANAVLDHQRQEKYKMAEYIAKGVPTVPARNGVDGGMNSAFASKLSVDSKGQVYLVAGNTTVPGALPRKPSPPATTEASQKSSQPVVMASVPISQTPRPKEGEAPQPPPTLIAGLFGNLFSGPQAQAQSSAEPAAARGTSTEMAAKPKRAAPVRTASAPAVPHPKPRETGSFKPDSVANNSPAPGPVQQGRDHTASSAPPPSGSGLLTDAQPVIPATSFESRWAALR
jgi:hypothetical protein